VIWPLLTLVLALLSAYIARRRFGLAENGPLGWLILLVLFFIYHLLPVHITAAAEIAGLVDNCTFPLLVAVGLLGLAATFALPTPASGTPLVASGAGVGTLRLATAPRYILLLIAVAVGSWLMFVVNATTSYSFGWDSLTYHLPLALSWLQAQSLSIPPSAHWQYSMPANGNISLMVMLAAGFVRLAFLPSTLVYGISAISVWLLARRLTANAEAALLAVILFVMLPIAQFHATGAYVDLFGASFILAGAALFAWRNDGGDGPSGSRWYTAAIALAGLAWGIAVGTKPIYYAYGGLFATGALVIIWRERAARGRSPFAIAALLIACMLVPSAFWFLRALAATGNPIFPIPVTIMGWTIFEGPPLDSITRGNPEKRFVASTLAWLIYPWVEYKDTGYAYGFSSGLGPAWATFVPLGLAFATYAAIKRRREVWARECAVLLGLTAVLMVLWWIGLRRLPRFGMPILALTCVLVVPLFAALLARRAAALRVLLVLSIMTGATLSTFVPAHEFLGRLRSGVMNWSAVFEIPDIFNHMPVGTVIWNAGAYEIWNLPLAGARLTNQVIFKRCWRVPDYGKFISENGIDYVVEFTPYSCGEIQKMDVKRVFEGKVGTTLKWRVWAVSPEAKATVF